MEQHGEPNCSYIPEFDRKDTMMTTDDSPCLHLKRIAMQTPYSIQLLDDLYTITELPS